VPDASREAVTGYRDALTWVLQMPDLGFFQHSEMVLSALHFMMIRHWPEKLPGRYRRGHIVVAGGESLTPAYVAPGIDEVPALMGELIDDLNRTDDAVHVLVKAALAHLNLVSIHPWRDGNGRMARCLQTLIIARGGRTWPEFCSIEEWLGFEINTYGYYHALGETRRTYQPERDTHGWVRFCLRAHHQQAQTVDRRLRFGADVWLAAGDIAGRHGLHRRTVAALYAAATDRLHRETYQAEEGLSRDQAIRDVRRIEQAGLVRAVGHGTTLHHLADGELKQAVDEIAASVTAPLTEPY
jgi:Fic family protein